MPKLEISIPLHPAYKPEKDRIDYFESAVEDIIALNGQLIFELPNHPPLEPRISKKINNSREYYSSLGKTWSSCLIFEIDLADEPIDYQDTFSSLSESEKVLQYQSEITLDISIELFHLFIFSNLSKPGGIKAQEGNIYIDGVIFGNTFPIHNFHRETLKDLEELNWIKYKEIPLINVIHWFKSNHFSFRRYSNSPTERALNSFTKLFSENLKDLTFHLFWSLIGVEASFCDKKEGISQQIVEKTQVLFGEMTSFKKRLKTMYDFRSRLIHGGLDFAPGNYYEEHDENEKFGDDLYQSAFLAVGILTCTIQELIERNKTEFNFKLILD